MKTVQKGHLTSRLRDHRDQGGHRQCILLCFDPKITKDLTKHIWLNTSLLVEQREQQQQQQLY